MWPWFPYFLSSSQLCPVQDAMFWEYGFPGTFFMTKMSDLPQRASEGGPYRTQVGFCLYFFGHLNLWIHWNSLMSGICWIWGHNRCDPKIKGYKEFGQGRCSLHPDVGTLHDSLSKGSFVCPTINSHFLCIKGAGTVGSPLVSNTLKASPRLERWSSLSRLPVLPKDHIFPLSL